ncbi:hypothetical protein EZJ43_11495 [Pedobacter changchengzhani]|uniref:Uncharacterized protein n=1 Tax=Pedobacter changchengzhani TaxID=2529274 RepID=A0A4R5ML71_9SPHI|nr:hypothetical protein [Pedobacter changchengzhani]TDG35965.1 hypothetical protein EZJ43_11495 [Pedobacter changchengzhani]
MRHIAIIILSLFFLMACKGKTGKNLSENNKVVASKAVIDSVKTRKDLPKTIIDTPITFNYKIVNNNTPLAFTFTYNKHLYKFYAYADYLLPNKKNKKQKHHELSINASIYGGYADDFNDGANITTEKDLIFNKPLKITGYLAVENHKLLNIKSGFLTVSVNNQNKISGTFTCEGYITNYLKGDGKALGAFKITDGKFEKIPVGVHYIADFEEGFIRMI